VRPPPRFLAAPALLAACLDRPPETTADACPLTERVLLAAAPAKFEPTPGTYYDFFADGDHLLYTFDPPTDPGRTYWHKQRCGGEPEKFPSLLPGLHHPFTIDTDGGPLLYARDADNNTFVVDRLDDPAADVPRRVLDLPPEATLLYYRSGRRYAWFGYATRAVEDITGAAAVGASTFAYYTHAGDPDVPAAVVGVSIVDTDLRDDHLLVLDDDGVLRRFDPFTGDDELLISGVRSFQRWSGDRLIWQAIGDDVAEPVYLRDLATGTDLQLAVNELAAASWGRTPEDGSVGTWFGTDDIAAMRGFDRTLALAVRTDTGAAVPIPAHVRFESTFDHELVLVLPDPEDHVEALWHPLTGEVRELYRGPLDPTILWFDGERAEYTVPDPGEDGLHSLWRVDLATGERTELLTKSPGSFSRREDGRYLLWSLSDFVDLPPLGDFNFSVSAGDIAYFDPETGVRHPLADAVVYPAVYPDEGLVVLDVHGPEPGVWAVPFPD
jgi:hypothetical protein